MSIEQGSFRRELAATGASLVCAVALFGLPSESAEAESLSPSGVADCVPYLNILRYRNEEYRACHSYMFDAVVTSLQGIYKYGQAPSRLNRELARHHFRTRYFPGARDVVENRVDKWVPGVNKVYEDVDLVSLSSDLGAQRALIKTREWWSVRNEQGQERMPSSLRLPHLEGHTLCQARQRIIPSRPKLKPYPEWLVVDDKIDPNYDCLDFAEKLKTGIIT